MQHKSCTNLQYLKQITSIPKVTLDKAVLFHLSLEFQLFLKHEKNIIIHDQKKKIFLGPKKPQNYCF